MKVLAFTEEQMSQARQLEREIPEGIFTVLLVHDTSTSVRFINQDGHISVVDIDGIHETQELIEDIRPELDSKHITIRGIVHKNYHSLDCKCGNCTREPD